MSPIRAITVSPVVSAIHRPLDVFLAGVGNVGGTLLRQIDDLAKAASVPALRLIGACTTSGHVLDVTGLSPSDIPTKLAQNTAPDWARLSDQLVSHGQSHPTVFVDATGHNRGADQFERLLAAGVSVVTPSKLANTRSQSAFDRLLRLGSGSNAHYKYETTVGAGLPVLGTLRDLIATGDTLLSARGVLSGTMTFMFEQIENGVSFGDAVQRAYQQGYSEPDPRDDLGGEDVARKLIILARTAGLRIERNDVTVESLVPPHIASLPVSLAIDAFSDVNSAWRERASVATSQGKRLRYVGTILPSTGGQAAVRVGVEPVPADSPMGRLSGTDNLVELTTNRYAHSPIVIQGPGAGPAVTAAGVLADLLDVARRVAPSADCDWGTMRP